MTMHGIDRRLAGGVREVLAIRCIERWAPEHAPETAELLRRYRDADTGFERSVARERLASHVARTLRRCSQT